MFHPVEVKALEPYKIWLRYSDGAAGEVDLADLADEPVFRLWQEEGAFSHVYITDHRAIAWSPDAELCADALYLRLTGLKPEDVFKQDGSRA